MIAILNMKLPPYCGKCPLQDGEICYAINENDIGSGLSFFDLEDLRNFCIKRRDDCPLIEIVNCGECKYYEKSEYIKEDMVCKYHIGHTYYTEADRFCCYGERKE